MTQSQPNFILIFPDQWRADCLGSAGNSSIRTSFVDTLARRGIRFANAYTPAPTCIPARASLLTGKSPYLAGRTGYQEKLSWNYPDTLITLLNDCGYRTVNVGKTHFYPQSDNHGFHINHLYDPLEIEEGFVSEYHQWLKEQTGGTIQDTASVHSNNSWVPLPWPYPEYLHPTNWTADTAIDELKQMDGSKPFFMQIGFHRPHPPYDPPVHYYETTRDRSLPPLAAGEWSERWNTEGADAMGGITGRLPEEVQDESRRAYYAAINHVDHQIGKILFQLGKQGLDENTYLIFVSDHGELLGDHHRRHKIMPLEGAARIPLIVVPPKALRPGAGRVCEHPVSLQDITPTILKEAGGRIPDEMDSIPFNALLSEEANREAHRRTWLHGEHAGEWQFVTDGREKLIWNSVSGEKLFFDLVRDPKETQNLADQKDCRERVALWEERLVQELSRPYRIQDGFADGEKLSPGKALAVTHPAHLP